MADTRLERYADDEELDDRSLVDAYVRSSSGESFRLIYRRHTPHLYRLAVGMLGGDQDAAQDTVQESWLRVSRQLHRFSWRSSLRTWLCGIVINCCREARRLARSTSEMGSESTSSGVPDIGLKLETIDLLRALDALPDGAREVLVLQGILGHTHEEISSILGIAPGTSKSQLSYARERLRERLRPSKEESDK